MYEVYHVDMWWTHSHKQPYSFLPNKPSRLSPPNKPSRLSPLNKPSGLSPLNKPSRLNPPNKPSRLNPTPLPSCTMSMHACSVHSHCTILYFLNTSVLQYLNSSYIQHRRRFITFFSHRRGQYTLLMSNCFLACFRASWSRPVGRALHGVVS